MLVERAPAFADEGGHEEQEGASRLVEVGDEGIHNAEGVARGDDERGGGIKAVATRCIHALQQCGEGIGARWGGVGLVGGPLREVQIA